MISIHRIGCVLTMSLQLHELGVLGRLPACTRAIDSWTYVSFYVCSCVVMGVIVLHTGGREGVGVEAMNLKKTIISLL